MAHPYHHSLSSVKKWGGDVADYQPIQTGSTSRRKSSPTSGTARCGITPRASSWPRPFSATTMTLSTGRVIPTRWIGEQHVREDLGFIPSFADWVKAIRPEPWMGRAQKLDDVIALALVPPNGGTRAVVVDPSLGKSSAIATDSKSHTTTWYTMRWR